MDRILVIDFRFLDLHRNDLRLRLALLLCHYLLDFNFCRDITKDVDIVFHCAANTSGAHVMSSTPLVHVTPNVVMNSQLMEASYEAKVKKFIFMSSSVVYPYTAEKPNHEEEFIFGDIYEKYFAVGWMKRYTEKLSNN